VSLEEGYEGNDANEDDLRDWMDATNYRPSFYHPAWGWTDIPDDFKVAWPGVINPTGTLWPIIGEGAFPGAFVVRTRDMKIAYVEVGAGEDAPIWDVFDSVMDDEPVLPGD